MFGGSASDPRGSEAASNEEGEAARVNERIDELRERMNSARTNKEYKALLTEVNTLKEERARHEDEAIERLEKIEALRTQLSEIEAQHGERVRMTEVAQSERDAREAGRGGGAHAVAAVHLEDDVEPVVQVKLHEFDARGVALA